MNNIFSKDRWSEILEALNANKLRTFLTAFGVSWGIFIFVALLALTNGLKNGVTADFGNFATNSMFMWTQGTSKPYKGLPKDNLTAFGSAAFVAEFNTYNIMKMSSM